MPLIKTPRSLRAAEISPGMRPVSEMLKMAMLVSTGSTFTPGILSKRRARYCALA